MTFGIFVMWVLMGVLAGVLAGLVFERGGYGLKRDITLGLIGGIGLGWLLRSIGVTSGSGWFAAVVVALAGAAIAIAGQRKVHPAERHDAAKAERWWRWGLGAAVVVIMGWMVFGPTPPPAAAVVDEKIHAVTPATLKVKAGIVTVEVVDMRVTERLEQGSDRAVSPPRLTARVVLRNGSTSQTVRLVTGTIQYIDAQGRPIALDDNRADPIVKFAAGERLDPGQEMTDSLDVDFPGQALKTGTLKTIRLKLAYAPSPYLEETASLPVSVGEK